MKICNNSTKFKMKMVCFKNMKALSIINLHKFKTYFMAEFLHKVSKINTKIYQNSMSEYYLSKFK